MFCDLYIIIFTIYIVLFLIDDILILIILCKYEKGWLDYEKDRNS